MILLAGTRPEVIKLAPVLWSLRRLSRSVRASFVLTGQHHDLVAPLLGPLGITPEADLGVMTEGQRPTEVLSAILAGLAPLLRSRRPSLLVVQGDTTSALAGAVAGYYERIPVAHVEAGLRSGNDDHPFPEEMQRSLITRLATIHFAPTAGNAERLVAEGVPREAVLVTGNPVVSALDAVLERFPPSPAVQDLVAEAEGRKLLLVTTHRRESFGRVMRERLACLREFVDRHPDVVLILPVHPNPEVRRAVREALAGAPRCRTIDPVPYPDFLHLARHAWLIVSDSGGIQEEAPSLGVPLLVIREHTERPEAVSSGHARLIGGGTEPLRRALESAHAEGWRPEPAPGANPFGRPDSAEAIARAIVRFLETGTLGEAGR